MLGDYKTTITPRPDLKPAERSALDSVRRERDQLIALMRKALDDLRQDLAKRDPGDQASSGEAEAEWTKRYKAMKEEKSFKDAKSRSEELAAAIGKFLAKPLRPGFSSEFETAHGYVWLFLRK